MIYYAIENLLARSNTAISSSSEDALYVAENLYNKRPSKPFRFTGVGLAGVPEWVCVEFEAPTRVTAVSSSISRSASMSMAMLTAAVPVRLPPRHWSM